MEAVHLHELERDLRLGTLRISEAQSDIRIVLRRQNERAVSFSRAARLKELGYASYNAYLASPYWIELRRRYFEDPNTPKECLCGETERLQLHHKTYVRLGAERTDDLRPLCPRCHTDVHVLARRGEMDLRLAGYTSAQRAQRYAAQNASSKAQREIEDLEHLREAVLAEIRDFKTERSGRNHGLDKRFCRIAREAGLHATPNELKTLRAVVNAVRAGALDSVDGTSAVRDLVRAHHQRHAKAA